ncbi:hypothetical protein GXW83_08975 [Streptacidiphilus sp. PB12-B1b]|uniref:hypothetical protein n=1 Tax=Streptacidiphilus sp. PB12-B1b TaxID=2705012 RepID=UPI0015F9D1E9|nr:hypothetical protein [Streptacidiphilus sp. PB12-B1b]QMU75852.1 hypothetical protein GXW83_08975 [Streptacidiphilus sp. PB12-B1b]
MMPRNTALTVPSHLRGEAGPDTLAALVADGRRMGLFWPKHTVGDPVAEAGVGAGQDRRPGSGFRVPASSAALLGAWLEREG